MAKRIVKENNTDLQIKNEESVQRLDVHHLPLSTLVWVKSNCYGELIYISSKTGFSTSWESYGSRQAMSLEELIIMRNSTNFFKKNRVVIDSFQDSEYEYLYTVEEILDFLNVKQYYKDAICPKNIDDIFKFSPSDIEKRVPKMSNGVKTTITIRANELIQSGELDSLKVISALEKALNCELSR